MMVRYGLCLITLLCATVAQAGHNVVVVLDDSGSMSGGMRSDRRTRKMDAAKQALIEVLQRLPDDAQVGVVVLNGRSAQDAWIVPLGPIDRQQMRTAIQGIRPSGGTPLGRFIKVGADALLALREREHYGMYRLLIVTDGEATDADLIEAYLPDILSRGLSVDVIGVDMEEAHSLATRVDTYRRADDSASLSRAISEVFAESSGAAVNTGETDFELLAEIPSELAAAALTALGASGNHPIGQEPVTMDGDRGQPGRSVPVPVSTSSGGSVGIMVMVALGLLCFVFGLVVFAVIGIVVVARRSGSR